MLLSKSKMKEDVIIRLNSDKLQLEKEVASLKERLNKEAEREVKPGKQVERKQNTRSLFSNPRAESCLNLTVL